MMSQEQPCVGDVSPAASSSKNAKDKNSSTTVEALHDCKHTEESNGRSGSEKDSGFSDNSSDSKHLDEKDECNKKQQKEAKEESCLNHNETRRKSNRRNVIVAPKKQQLQSFYIIKNSVQPDIVQKNAQVLWSSGAMPSVSGSNPILLLQPSPPPPFPKSAGKSKNDATTKKTNAANVPVITYPRIAPRPHKKTTSNGEINQSKRVCIESNSTTQANRNPQETPKVDPSTSQPCASSASISPTQPSSTASTNSTSELNKTSVINTRHRRFFNTVQVLKKSGLWDMTLRTKELMRQSNATRREIAQLRQHSDLLCQLASNNQTSGDQNKLLGLHRDMAESGSYPGLKDIEDLQVQNAERESEGESSSVKNGEGDGDEGRPVVSEDARETSDPTPKQGSESAEDPKRSDEEQPEKTSLGDASED